MFISENSLYTNSIEKDALLKDNERLMDSLVFNFLGFLGLYKMNSRRGFMTTYEQTEGKLFINNIGDSNHDVSLCIKMAHDANLITIDTVNRMTKLLVLIKQKKITDTNLDEAIVRTIFDNVKYQAHRPSAMVFAILDRFHNGAYTLEKAATELWEISRRKEFIGITGEFRNIVMRGQYQPLFAQYSKVAPVQPTVQPVVKTPIAPSVVAKPFTATVTALPPKPIAPPVFIPPPPPIVVPPPKVYPEFGYTKMEISTIFMMNSVTEINDWLRKIYDIDFSKLDLNKFAESIFPAFRSTFFQTPSLQSFLQKAVIAVTRSGGYSKQILKEFAEKYLSAFLGYSKYNNMMVEWPELFRTLALMKIGFFSQIGVNPNHDLYFRWIFEKWAVYYLKSDHTKQEMEEGFKDLKEVLDLLTTTVNLYTKISDFVPPGHLKVDPQISVELHNVLLLDPNFIASQSLAWKNRAIERTFGKGFIQEEGPTIKISRAQYDYAVQKNYSKYVPQLKDMGVIEIVELDAASRPAMIAKSITITLDVDNYTTYDIKYQISHIQENLFGLLGGNDVYKIWNDLTGDDIEKAIEILKKENNTRLKSFLGTFLQAFHMDFNPNDRYWEVFAKIASELLDDVSNYNIFCIITHKDFRSDEIKEKFIEKLNYKSLTQDISDFFKIGIRWENVSIPIINDIFKKIENSQLVEDNGVNVETVFRCNRKDFAEKGLNILMIQDRDKAKQFVTNLLQPMRISADVRLDFFPAFFAKFPELKQEVIAWFESQEGYFSIFASNFVMRLEYLDDDMISDKILDSYQNALKTKLGSGRSLNFPTNSDEVKHSKKLSQVFRNVANTLINDDDQTKFTSGSYYNPVDPRFATMFKDAGGKEINDFLKRFDGVREVIAKRFDSSSYAAFGIADVFENLSKNDSFAKEAEPAVFAKWFNNVVLTMNDEKRLFDKSNRERVFKAGAAIFGNIKEAGRIQVCEDAFDELINPAKKAVIGDILQYRFIDAAKDALNNGEIKPLFNVNHKRMIEVFKYNKITVPNIDLKTYRSYRDIEVYGKRMKALAELAVTPVVPSSSDYLEKKSIEYDFFNKYRHGNRAFLFHKEFTVDLDIQRRGMLEFITAHPTTEAMDPVFHGTGSLAASMILRYGFKVISTSDSAVTGRMLGDGIYFSNILDKAGQYMVDNQMSRKVGEKGYILQCKAILGDRGTNYSVAGIGGGTRTVVSPEWCVFEGNKQLYIYKAYLTEVITKQEMDSLRRKHAGKMQENIMKIETFREFLRESNTPEYSNASTWSFIDGKIPVNEMTVVEFEQWNPQSFGPHVRLEFGQTGPMVVIEHNGEESEGFAVRYVDDLMKDYDQLNKFLGLLKDPNYTVENNK